ncbi:MAG TPA: cupin domain-containing protein [Symbiobacteriaceae bacterium]|nr:cupin domain-containing protein [Symbiobacteriaceae bacterium]
MEKQEYEFYPVEERPFEPIPGNKVPGLSHRVLAGDPTSDDFTRILKMEPGTDTTANGVQTHTCWEEVYILTGSMIDLRLNKEFVAGTYACRPPGMEHGPWISPSGCTTFECRYSAKKK